MKKLRVLDLFSGIGGFSLGLERSGGFETVAFCEIEPYCRAVLKKHWPDVPCYEDVRTLTADTLRQHGIAVDVICGGFPCQDLSAAGNQAGMDGTRSGLWSEIARLMGELRPRFAIVENVTALLSGPSQRPGQWFGRVLGDLAAFGYDAEWHCIPASAIGAHHRRDRVWLVAYSGQVRCDAGWSGKSLPRSRLEGEAFAFQPMADTESVERGTGLCEAEAQRDGHFTTDGSDAVPDARAFGRERTAAHPKLARHIRSAVCDLDVGIWRREPEQTPRVVESRMGGMANGVPNRMDRIAALGNAVVPQIPELIGKAIMQAEGMSP
jgi:DNA (cytosine-5)-methyltransferase 1